MGGIKPITTKLLIRLNKARANTTTPADLKKSGACFELAKDTELNDNKPRTGSVPRAKKNIIINPEVNDPLESAAICIA